MSGFSLSALKNTLDEVRAQVYPRNETERKVYEALSSKNYGASSTLMGEIASETFDYEKYKIITTLLFSSLDADGRTWKQIFKSLTLIEFLIKNGAERFIEECRDRLYKIRSLQDFNYYEGTVDKGQGVREKAKQVVELLASNDMIRTEREKARVLRNKLAGFDGGQTGRGGIGSDSFGGGGRRYSETVDRDREEPRGNSSRYGGGAYDSDRPTRYGDDISEDRADDSRSFTKATRADPRPDPFEDSGSVSPKHSKSNLAAPASNAGKLKVSIKSKPAGKTGNSEVSVGNSADVDLLGDFASAAPVEDPFAGPTHSRTSSSVTDFDPFGPTPVATTAPPAVVAFDPFAAPPTTAPASTPAAFDPFGAPAAPTFPGGFSSAPNYPSSAHIMPTSSAPSAFSAPYSQPFPAQQQSPPLILTSQPVVPQRNVAANDADFGDFAGPATSQAPPSSAPVATPKPADKWSDLSNLVDLTKIEKNDDISKQKAAAQARSTQQGIADSSFAGLDGFSKTSQPMSSTRPLNSYGGSAPPRQPVMTGPPAAPAHLGPNMGMGMGMGMNMGMGGATAPYGQPGQFGNMPMGMQPTPGYNPGAGYGAAPGGAFGAPYPNVSATPPYGAPMPPYGAPGGAYPGSMYGPPRGY